MYYVLTNYRLLFILTVTPSQGHWYICLKSKLINEKIQCILIFTPASKVPKIELGDRGSHLLFNIMMY